MLNHTFSLYFQNTPVLLWLSTNKVQAERCVHQQVQPVVTEIDTSLKVTLVCKQFMDALAFCVLYKHWFTAISHQP